MDFCRQVEKQNILKERVHRDMLARGFSDLVLPEELVHRLGPAVNSGKSILLYGPPGNGKTCIAEAIGRSFRNAIYLPYCIEVDGQIINFYDETVHHKVETPVTAKSGNGVLSGRSNRPDPRWILCRRPVVTTGGELTLSMLDLSFNNIAKFYEAPLQFKATGGVMVVDDFGRQQNTPQSILNRWIVPLERGVDFLTLHTGKTFPVPFNELVVFSTNIRPRELSDEATLRRLYYKIEVPIPTEEDYRKIFHNVCAEKDLPLPDDILPYLFDEFYSKGEVPRGGYQPKYIVDQVIAQCEYEDIPARLDKNLVRMAWLNLFAN
jgi:predicted ATPase with chaperone activity